MLHSTYPTLSIIVSQQNYWTGIVLLSLHSRKQQYCCDYWESIQRVNFTSFHVIFLIDITDTHVRQIACYHPQSITIDGHLIFWSENHSYLSYIIKNVLPFMVMRYTKFERQTKCKMMITGNFFSVFI